MTGLLLTGGEGPSKRGIEAFIRNIDFIIAADSGLDLARKLQIVPDLIVGDMDSLESTKILESYSKKMIQVYPPDKDETDTEIALRILKEKKVDRVILAGGGGGRLDHLLGILILFERDFHPDIWLTAREHVEIIKETAHFDSFPGQSYSFFPVGGSAKCLASIGLKWPLNGLIWRRGEAGISNVAVSEYVTITLEKGTLLMVREITHGERQ